MADSKKYIGIYDTLEDVQDALDNGQLSKPYVAKTMDNGHLDYNSLSPVDYSQYWCTYYPVDAKIWVMTSDGYWGNRIEYTGGDGKISKADFPDFYCAGSTRSSDASTVTKFKYFQFDSTSATTSFNGAWHNCSSLISFPQLDLHNGTDFNYAWQNCSSLTEFPTLDLHNGTNFGGAWGGCSRLTSFPALDLSKGTKFSSAWSDCSSLTEFPVLNVSNGTDFEGAWHNCSSLISFPQLDLSSGTKFMHAWSACSSLTSFPQLDLSSGTDASNAWAGCSSLTTLGGFGAIKADIDLSTSTLLTVESLMNVINQAATVTGKTMKFGSDNLAKLTDAQKSVATSKGWTLA